MALMRPSRHPLLFVLMALLLVLAPYSGLATVNVAHAETIVLDEGPPKGVVGQDGIRCIGTASAGGHTVTLVQYIGADGDEMANNPDRERSWQSNYCEWAQRQTVGGVPGVFRFKYGIDIDPNDVKVSTERL